MYALSVKQPWAELIARGEKRIEYRSWRTNHRGDLLIVASKSPDEDGFADSEVDPDAVVYGAAVCVVQLSNVTGSFGDYRWHVAKPRRVKPIALRGYAALYTVADEQVVFTGGKKQVLPVVGAPVARPKDRDPPKRGPRAQPLMAMLGADDVEEVDDDTFDGVPEMLGGEATRPSRRATPSPTRVR
jgi:hypothetical protein